MSEVNPIAPSVAELRGLIEQDVIYRHCIALGDVQDQCIEYSPHFSEQFSKYGIDHVLLRRDEHSMLAVRTRDHGIVVFDPTFEQFYPGHPGHYFLGSAQHLVDYVTQRGGKDGLHAVIAPPYAGCPAVTAATAFFNAPIRLSPFAPRDQGPAAVSAYFREWTEALAPIHATTHLQAQSTRNAQDARSNRLVSP